MKITDEAVKAAVDKWRDHEFDGLRDFHRMRAALEAALPHLSKGAVRVADILLKIALWSDDEGLELSMGQGDELARSILSALSPAPVGVTDKMVLKFIATARDEDAGYRDWTEAGTAGLKAALTSHEPAPTDTQERKELGYDAHGNLTTFNTRDDDTQAGLDALTACQQEVERLRGERDNAIGLLETQSKLHRKATARAEAAEARILELKTDLAIADDEILKLENALTPSAETKAAYMGEFHMGVTLMHNGDEDYRRVMIPWTSIKEIMAAIRARAVLGGQGNS